MRQPLDDAIDRSDLPGLVAELYPESGARSGRKGVVKACWRNEARSSFSLYKSKDKTRWLFKDMATGLAGNAYTFLVEIHGMAGSRAANFLLGEDVRDFEPREHQRRAKEEAERDANDKRRNVAREYQLWQVLPTMGRSTYLEERWFDRVEGGRYGSDRRGDYLALLVEDAAGHYRGLQKIYRDQKRFTWGMEKVGGFIRFGTLETEHIYLAEGVSSGYAVHLATSATTLCALDCGNLEAVLANLTQMRQVRTYVIAADNDRWKASRVHNGRVLGNVGLKKARQAAMKYRCGLSTPNFKEYPQERMPKDFYDLSVLGGLEEVRAQLARAALQYVPNVRPGTRLR